MLRTTLIAAAAAAVLAVPGLALAQQTGSAAEARTMLDKAAAAVRATLDDMVARRSNCRDSSGSAAS